MLVHVVCSTDRVQLIDTYQYPDSEKAFKREPFCAKFRLCDTGRPTCQDAVSVSTARQDRAVLATIVESVCLFVCPSALR